MVPSKPDAVITPSSPVGAAILSGSRPDLSPRDIYRGHVTIKQNDFPSALDWAKKKLRADD